MADRVPEYEALLEFLQDTDAFRVGPRIIYRDATRALKLAKDLDIDPPGWLKRLGKGKVKRGGNKN